MRGIKIILNETLKIDLTTVCLVFSFHHTKSNDIVEMGFNSNVMIRDQFDTFMLFHISGIAQTSN